ncbi:hypothetical protein [Bradyrhizobium sp. STM 3562]|uniref:hypothetical protein n=1 Tax=Bradyrhizobium sp. STM 3562 TaxID=578924 RepID=UPI00388D0E94
MLKAAQKIALSSSHDVSSSRMVLSRLNVRQANAGVSIEQLPKSVDLASGPQLWRVRVIDAHRIGLSGFSVGMPDRLKSYGLFHEIISWKLRRVVVAAAISAARVMAEVPERYYPVDGVCEGAAA